MLTQTYTPSPIHEMWFVYDPTDGFRTHRSEKEAFDDFHKTIQKYRDDAAGDEWCDEVEDAVWGKVFQTVELIPVDPPKGLVEEDPDFYDGADFAEAFAVEHRGCHNNCLREEMRRYLYRNVACEFRKGLRDFSHMPDLPGWA